MRTLNAPLLLIIGLLERRTLWAGNQRQKEAEQLPRLEIRAGLWDFSRGFSVHGDIQAVFDAEPPQEIEELIENDDDLSQHVLEREFAREFAGSSKVSKDVKTGRDAKKGEEEIKKGKSRRDSIYPFASPKLQRRLTQLTMDDDEDNDDDDEGDTTERLKALEKSSKRIEELLGKLCASLDEPPRTGSSVDDTIGETGTMQDLDRSVSADIDH